MTAGPSPTTGRAPMGPTRLTLSKPVIAAVEGYAVAGGIELALWCDLRVAAEDAVFGVFCRRFGVPLCDLGTVRLPRIVGPRPRHGPDPDRPRRGGARGARHGAGQPGRRRPAQALAAAVTLAHQLAALPQVCLRSDRMSALEQWGLTEEEAAVGEARRGRDVIAQRRDARRGGAIRGGCGPRWRCARLTTTAGAGPSAHRRDRPTVAAFDFDGTLTDAGSVFPFLVSLRGLLARAARRRPGSRPPCCGPPSRGARRPTRSRRSCSPACSAASPSTRSTAAPPPSPTATCQRHLPRRHAPAARVAPGARATTRSSSRPRPSATCSPAGEELGVDGVRRHPARRRRRRAPHRRLRGEELPGGGEVRPPRSSTSAPRACCRATAASSPCCGPTATAAGDLRLLNAADHGVDAGRLGPLGRLRRFPRLAARLGVSPA